MWVKNRVFLLVSVLRVCLVCKTEGGRAYGQFSGGSELFRQTPSEPISLKRDVSEVLVFTNGCRKMLLLVGQRPLVQLIR